MQERVYIVQTPVRDTSRCEKDLTQRLIDTRASQSHSLIYGYGASISQNVIDEAVGQWKKAVTCRREDEGHSFEHLLN